MNNSNAKLSEDDLCRWADAMARLPADASEFVAWLEGPLRRFYPFQGLLLTHGERVAGEIKITHLLASGHDAAYITQIQKTFDLAKRGSLWQWLTTGEPVTIDLCGPAETASDFEIAEMLQFGFQTVTGHGVLNMNSTAGTYFSFTNVRLPLDAWHRQALMYIAPHLNALFIKHCSRDRSHSHTELESMTRRQREIVRLLATGLNDKRIGQQLAITEKTVRNQLTSIYTALGIHKRTELMAYLR